MFSPGKFIDEAWMLYRNNFKYFWKIAAWFFIVSTLQAVLLFLAPTYNELPFVNAVSDSFTTLTIVVAIASLVTTIIVAPIVSIWISIGIIRTCDTAYNRSIPSVRDIVRSSGKWLLGAIGISILTSLILAACLVIPMIPGTVLIVVAGFGSASSTVGVIGAILFLIGLIIGLVYMIKYAVELSFASYQYVLEGQTVIESMKSSMRLVKGNWWPVAITILLIAVFLSLIAILVDTAVFYGGSALVNLLSFNPTLLERSAGILDIIVTWGFYVIFTPLSIVPIYVLYRKTKEKKKA